ncbi:MAG: hypothetical protein EXR79_12485 [Myxococcales bacterium]|nr:hypothetical protein [Myxococcales bacterium]
MPTSTTQGRAMAAKPVATRSRPKMPLPGSEWRRPASTLNVPPSTANAVRTANEMRNVAMAMAMALRRSRSSTTPAGSTARSSGSGRALANVANPDMVRRSIRPTVLPRHVARGRDARYALRRGRGRNPSMAPSLRTAPHSALWASGRAGPAPWRVWRVRQWLHFLALPLAAIGPEAWLHDTARAAATVAPGLALAALLLGAAYGWNACADAATDACTQKNPLAGNAVPYSAWAWSTGAAAAALVLALGRGPWVAAATATSLGASWGYSLGPRWKARPGVGLLANCMIFIPILFVAGTWSPARMGMFAFLLGALLLQNQLLHECEDRREDAAAGDHTTAQWLGGRAARAAVGALGVAAALGVVGMAGVGGAARGAGLAGGSSAIVAVALLGCTAWSLCTPTASIARARHRRVAFLCGVLAYGLGA